MEHTWSTIGLLTTARPDPRALSNLQILLWAGVAVLSLLFGLIVLLTVLRIVRRRYFRRDAAPAAAPESPWKAAGQRAAPVAGGEMLEGATPDDDPDSYSQRRETESSNEDDDPNSDTGPFPDDDEDEFDGDEWKRN